MATRVFDPLSLDVQAFAQDAGELHGSWSLDGFKRIAPALHGQASPSDSAAVVWRARGELRAARGLPAQPWLHLTASACLGLECQRCLEAVETELAIDRWFHFVPGEDAAAEIDADSDDDVLALTRALDLSELVEDELLLALPLVPRHEVCPDPLRAPPDTSLEADEEPRPFAALAALKRGGSLN